MTLRWNNNKTRDFLICDKCSMYPIMPEVLIEEYQAMNHSIKEIKDDDLLDFLSEIHMGQCDLSKVE